MTKDTLPDLERSIPYFDQASEKDPNFAPAYAAATDARVLLTTWNNTSALEALSKAKADALKAVELNPAFAEAHAALGSVNFYFEWKWPEAEANIKRALELNPSNPNIHILYADYLISQGRRRAAMSHIEQAIQLDPVSLLTNGLSAYAYLRARQYDEAIAQAERMIELEPKSPAAHYCLISAYNFKGMYEEARDLILKRMAEDGEKQEYIDALKQGDAKEAIERLERRQFEGLKEALSKGEKANATWVAQVSAKMAIKTWLSSGWRRHTPNAFLHSFMKYSSGLGFASSRFSRRSSIAASRISFPLKEQKVPGHRSTARHQLSNCLNLPNQFVPLLSGECCFSTAQLRAAQCDVIFQVNPTDLVLLPPRCFDISIYRIRISEPRQINACANRKPIHFHTRVLMSSSLKSLSRSS